MKVTGEGDQFLCMRLVEASEGGFIWQKQNKTKQNDLRAEATKTVLKYLQGF